VLREGSNYVIIHPKANFRSLERVRSCSWTLSYIQIYLEKRATTSWLSSPLVLFSSFVKNREVSERRKRDLSQSWAQSNGLYLIQSDSLCLSSDEDIRADYNFLTAHIITLRLSASLINKAERLFPAFNSPMDLLGLIQKALIDWGISKSVAARE